MFLIFAKIVNKIFTKQKKYWLLFDETDDRIDISCFQKCDSAATEARSGKSTAQNSIDTPGNGNQGVELFWGDLVVVAQRIVALVH